MYRMKSEIVTFLSMFSALDIVEDPTLVEKEKLSVLYRRIRKLGEERDWDLQVLHLQFIRAMGNKVQNYVIKLAIPRKQEPNDYN